MRVLMMGPPGVGKGTQASRLSAVLGVPAISTGELFREHVAVGSEIGRRMSATIAAGAFVLDEVTNEMVAERLARDDAAGGFVLDGFPRTLAQAYELDRLLRGSNATLSRVVVLSAAPTVVVERLLRRAEIENRADDTEPVIRRRLEEYDAWTAPVLDVYRRRGCLVEIDAVGAPESVARRISLALPR